MNPETVKDYFQKDQVVFDYAKAVDEVGLWNSERALICEYLQPQSEILELGCGAGRIGINLTLSGFTNVTSTDFCPNMVEAAKKIATSKNLTIKIAVCDATQIDFPKESFDAVIFGFNGLMQIPKSANRIKAMQEIFKVLKDGGIFIFTTHNRNTKSNQEYWQTQERQWKHNCQNPILDEFGDLYYRGDHGNVYIHSPAPEEIETALKKSGFTLLKSQLRSQIAQESPATLDFSDDCIFWIAQKKL